MKAVVALINKEWRHRRILLLFMLLGIVVLCSALHLLSYIEAVKPYIGNIAFGLMIGLPLLFCLCITDAFAHEFDRNTMPLLLGLPVRPGQIYWIKYLVSVASFVILSLGLEILLPLLSVSDINFFTGLTVHQQLLFAGCIAVVLLLFHAMVFFCSLVGRSTSNSIIAFIIVPLLYVFTTPAVALILMFVPGFDWSTIMIFLFVDGLLLYTGLIIFCNWLWCRRISRGRKIVVPLVFAAISVILFGWVIYLIAYTWGAYEYHSAVAAAEKRGMITDYRDHMKPFAPDDVDIVPMLEKFNREYTRVKKEHAAKFQVFDEFIENTTDLKVGHWRRRKPRQPEEKAIDEAVQFFLHSPEATKLYSMLVQIANTPHARMDLSYSDYTQRDSAWNRGSVFYSLVFLTLRAFAYRQTGQDGAMISSWRTALKLMDIRSRDDIYADYYYKYRLVSSIIKSGVCTPAAGNFYHELSADQGECESSASLKDISWLTEFHRDAPDILSLQLLKGYMYIYYDGGYALKELSSWELVLLRTLVWSRTNYLSAERIRQRIVLLDLYELAQKTPLFKDIQELHNRCLSDLVTGTPLGLDMTVITGYYNFRKLNNANQLALALLSYRCEHGSFPATLEQLTPKLIKQIPHGTFTGKPFTYSYDDNGFTLSNDDAPEGARSGLYDLKITFRCLPETQQENK
ncbi:MAG: ABC transporter permease [Victivallales bacterium]|nr:ABC transporter permease [Victivallales bacterium]